MIMNSWVCHDLANFLLREVELETFPFYCFSPSVFSLAVKMFHNTLPSPA